MTRNLGILESLSFLFYVYDFAPIFLWGRKSEGRKVEKERIHRVVFV